jgi:hypothetical protein
VDKKEILIPLQTPDEFLTFLDHKGTDLLMCNEIQMMPGKYFP